MLRAAVLAAAIASVCASCRPAGSVDPIGYGSSTSVERGRAPVRRATQTAKEVLTGEHRAPVKLAAAFAVPGGSVVPYTYGRLQARIGERTATGRDVVAELEEARQACEDERAALDPGERDFIEAEGPACSTIAAQKLFADDQLTPECQALGVAYFDSAGILLAHVELGGPCVQTIDSIEPYDLTPEPDDELLLIATYETLGELGRGGGWGRIRTATSLHVLAVRPGELVEQLDLALDESLDGGNCNHGVRRSVRVAGPGMLEVFSQEWNECAEEDCIPEAEAAAAAQAAEEDEVAPDIALCDAMPVTAARTRWSPETATWTVLEQLDHRGSTLPDGIMR